MDCDVVLIPSEDISGKAILASRELSKLGSSFVLREGELYPHLSLYIARFKAADMARVADALREIAGKTHAFQLRATDYVSSHKYVVANYEKIPALVTLQNELVNALNLLRDGMPESEEENMREATEPAVRKNFARYGYKYVGPFFVPHVTLIRFTEEHQLEELALPDQSIFDGNFASIGLFDLGLHSTCTRKLAEFPLAD